MQRKFNRTDSFLTAPHLILGMVVFIFGLVGVGCQKAVETVDTAVITPTLFPPPPTIAATSTSTPLGVETAVPTTTPTSSPQTPIPTNTPTPNYPIYQGAPLQSDLMGIQLHLRDEDQDEIFEHLDRLGMGWVKVQISWKLYQPYPDDFHAERFAELDQFVATANAHNIKVLLGVSKAPEWSRPTTELDGPPSDFAHFETFMAFLAARYQGQVAAYELWNEPNLMREWNGRSLNAADLVELIRFGANGVRQHDPNAILISAAPATTGINDGISAIDDRVYLRNMLDAGLANYINAIGAHPYGWANPPDSSFANPAPHTVGHNDHPSFFFTDTLNDYTAIMNESGTSLPIWVTEFGWGSFDGLDAPPPPGVEYMGNVTAWQQAEYTLRAYELAQTNNQIGPLFLWNLNFGPLLGNDFPESGYSLLTRDNSPRPSYLAFLAALSNHE
ncbi:MAG: hypothetical protein DWQ04_08130 [Chloroflexi bacterium]|nr:MAG: hypothetical protein DWQ04_08130 [Chloroflexota bacterium]